MSNGYDHIFKAANEAAEATGREFVVVKVNGAVRMLCLEEFFNLPPDAEVELLHATVALKVRGGAVIGVTEPAPRRSWLMPHQQSRRVGPADREAVEEARRYMEHDAAYAHGLKAKRERSKLAKFFRDLFSGIRGGVWILAVALGIATNLVGCADAPTEPKLMCVDYADTASTSVTPGQCTLVP